jgi:hypothetical protein
VSLSSRTGEKKTTSAVVTSGGREGFFYVDRDWVWVVVENVGFWIAIGIFFSNRKTPYHIYVRFGMGIGFGLVIQF